MLLRTSKIIQGFIVIAALAMVPNSVHAGLATLSASSWNVHSGNGNHQLFSKLSLSSYFSVFGLPASITAPLVLTSKFIHGTIDAQRFAPGDLSFYIGKSFENLEPRFGFSLPLFYSTKGAWIGTKNARLRLGAGYRASNEFVEGVRLSGEIMMSMSLNNPGGLLKAPSSSLYMSVKGKRELNKRLNLGAELLATGKYSIWKKWRNAYNNDNVRELGGGIYPAVFADFRFTRSFYASMNVGGGPGFVLSSAKVPMADADGTFGWSSSISISGNSYF